MAVTSLTSDLNLIFRMTTEAYVVMNNTETYTRCDNHAQAVSDAPVNFTLLGIFTTTVLLQWNVTCDLDTGIQLNSFSLHVNPLTSDWMSDADLLSFVVTMISGDTRQYRLQNLIPQTLYNVYLTSVNRFGSSNASEVISFRTLSATSVEYHQIVVKPIEVILVFGILTAWFMTIVLFLRKWGTIRISQPGGHSKYHQPKNLENIKVVNTANDSVIYRSYGQGYHRTMQARQKHLDKMHTVPNIKLQNIPGNKAKYLSQDNTSFKNTSTLKRTGLENYPRPSVSNLTSPLATGIKLKPKRSANVGNMENYVMDMFPEELVEQSDKEGSSDNLVHAEQNVDTELKSQIKDNNNRKCIDSIDEVQSEENVDNSKSSAIAVPVRSMEYDKNTSESRQGDVSCPQASSASNPGSEKGETTDCSIQFKKNANVDDECVEEMYRSTTV